MTESDVHSGLPAVIAEGDLRSSLVAIRDLLAGDLDDATWDTHKSECHCICGMSDVRARVAISKELRAVLDAIEALPDAKKEATLVDGIVARASAKRDELASRRAGRAAGAPAS